jgi:hypothetical protein
MAWENESDEWQGNGEMGKLRNGDIGTLGHWDIGTCKNGEIRFAIRD